MKALSTDPMQAWGVKTIVESNSLQISIYQFRLIYGHFYFPILSRKSRDHLFWLWPHRKIVISDLCSKFDYRNLRCNYNVITLYSPEVEIKTLIFGFWNGEGKRWAVYISCRFMSFYVTQALLTHFCPCEIARACIFRSVAIGIG